jgi:tetratricopeptide (TPR) repeat protein
MHASGATMTQDTRTAAASRKKNSAAKSDGHPRGRTEPVFQHYEAAVLLLQQGKFEKALAALEKILPEAPAEIRDRCRMYISTCQRQLQARARSFPSPEEHYDYAISLLNTGYYEEAREQLGQILGNHPGADYAFYGLAVLESITGRAQDCLSNLARAIELNPKCRVQARVDNDFQNMADDPRFTELLYPEVP